MTFQCQLIPIFCFTVRSCASVCTTYLFFLIITRYAIHVEFNVLATGTIIFVDILLTHVSLINHPPVVKIDQYMLETYSPRS